MRDGSFCHRDANDQKFKKKDGATANQLKKAIAVADMNLLQWFMSHLLRSLLIRTVMPAHEQAAAKVRVDVIPSPIVYMVITAGFLKLLLTQIAYASITASDKLHKLCNPTAATRYLKAVTEGKSEVVAMTVRETTVKMNWQRRRASPVGVPGMPCTSFILTLRGGAASFLPSIRGGGSTGCTAGRLIPKPSFHKKRSSKTQILQSEIISTYNITTKNDEEGNCIRAAEENDSQQICYGICRWCRPTLGIGF